MMYLPEGQKIQKVFVKGSPTIIIFRLMYDCIVCFNNFEQFENLDGTNIQRHGKVWLHEIFQQIQKGKKIYNTF